MAVIMRYGSLSRRRGDHIKLRPGGWEGNHYHITPNPMAPPSPLADVYNRGHRGAPGPEIVSGMRPLPFGLSHAPDNRRLNSGQISNTNDRAGNRGFAARSEQDTSTMKCAYHGMFCAAFAIATACSMPWGGGGTGRRATAAQVASTATSPQAESEKLWVAKPLTAPGEFTPGIEGPACDPQGNVLAVNYQRQGTIGLVTPDGRGAVFVELPAGSIGNGIRFNAKGNFYVADYTGHQILEVDPISKQITVLAHNPALNQPNDLAIADDGTIYASDPNWAESTGQLWRIDADGKTTRLAKDLGTTNGIDVSPDGKTLYVNESVQRNVWAFTIQPDRTLGDKRLVRKFEDHGFDGMRVDVDGNLYLTRFGKGTVVKLTPAGEILQEIDVLGARPSNLCFGGPDGRTVYVTEVEHTRLVEFRVDRPGRSWRQWSKN